MYKNAGQNKSLKKCDKFKIFGNISNKSKFHSQRNEEHIKSGDYLIAFSSESFFFLSGSMKVKMYETIILPDCFVQVWNLVIHPCGNGMRFLRVWC